MNFHKTSLGFFPTPLHHLPNLSAHIGSHQIYIKRDDLTGLATGGNKVRKLEFFIQEALDQGADTVITAGAQQSNHCRQTAAACALKGLECHLLLGGEKPTNYGGNLLLSHILGAQIYFTGKNRKGEDLEGVQAELVTQGRKTYVIPYGGSNLIGAQGFILAMKEFQEQLTHQNLSIDAVFFASSSGGMQAGMMLGASMFKVNSVLFPISIDKEGELEEKIQEIVFEGCQKYDLSTSMIENTKLIRDYDQAGYGVVTQAETSAIELLARKEGILLDPVYTARAFHGMLEHLKKGLVKPGSNVLFWHTGGLPALFESKE
jgi:D-cysteine desulfhydrase family pyridoxal phosphate-dependent enzyme